MVPNKRFEKVHLQNKKVRNQMKGTECGQKGT